MSKLHFTFTEAIFRKNVFLLKKLNNRTILLRHWAKFFRIFCVVFPQVRHTSILHIEETSSVKFLIWKGGSTLLFGFLVKKFWRSHEVFIYWCPFSRFGPQHFFEKLVSPKFSCNLNRAFSGVWPENLGQVCWSYILMGQWKFPWWIFFEKRLLLQFFHDVKRSTCGHFAETFCEGIQSCILVVEKNSSRKNIHSGKKHV